MYYYHKKILKRASFFSGIFLIMMLWYLLAISDSNIGKNLKIVIPPQICPFIVWGVMIGYLFFPSYKIFNGPGR